MSRPPPGNRTDYRVFRALQTRWMDNDIYGHMNNVVHYSLFDTAVNGWMIDAGVLDLQSSTTVGLVVETGCRYAEALAFPDRVTAGLRVAALGRSSVRFEIGLFRNDAQTAAAEGFFVHVHVDRKSHRPVAIDARHRAAFRELMPSPPPTSG